MKEYTREEISQLLERIRKLEETEKRYNALFDRTNDAVFLINMDGTHREVNQRAAEMLGYEKSEIEGKRADLFIAEHEVGESLIVKKALAQGKHLPIYERVFKKKDGTLLYGENDVTLVTDKKGNPQYFFSIVRDVSERKKYENLLRELAGTDSLTGLFNRRKMLEEIHIEAVRSTRRGKSFSLILLDIDLFKGINDKYGHECGDYVLVAISEIFKTKLREQDLCCRWGGEEFLILLPETEAEGGEISAEKLRLAVLDHKFNYKNENIPVSITLGVSRYRENQTIEECINLADIALYRGKNAGRNQTVLS